MHRQSLFRIIGGALVLCLCFFIWRFFQMPLLVESTQSKVSATTTVSGTSPIAQGIGKSAVVGNSAPILSTRVRGFLDRERQRLGTTTDSPELDAIRLREFAELLTADEIQALATLAISNDPNQVADDRFLAAFLLAQNSSVLALDSLVAVALAPMPSGLTMTPAGAGSGSPAPHGDQIGAQRQSFEQAIRAQAVEGIARQRDTQAARAAARTVAERSSSTFVVDRAQRVLRQLNGGPSVADQDKEALKSVLQH